jgi:hypothetical protein
MARKFGKLELYQFARSIRQTYAKHNFEELIERIAPHTTGMKMIGGRVAAETIYRCRLCNELLTSAISEFSYNPHPRADSYQRVGRPGERVFYASTSPLAAKYEVRPGVGDIVYLSRWRLTQPPICFTFGYDEAVYRKLNPGNEVPPHFKQRFSDQTSRLNELYRVCNEALATPSLKEDKIHMLSSAFLEALGYSSGMTIEGDLPGVLRNRKIDGVLYPAVAMRLLADNLALKPDYIDEFARLEWVEKILVERVNEDGPYEFSILDFGVPDYSRGVIVWKGRLPGAWLQAGERYTAGFKEGVFSVLADESPRMA